MDKDTNARKGYIKWIALIAGITIITVVFLIFSTNIFINHSCVGITLSDHDPGLDLIVRLFDSEKKAEKFYKSTDISAYYIVAVDADSDVKTSDVWFKSLHAPLVAKNAKFVSLQGTEANTLFDTFFDSNSLIIYHKGPGLDNGSIEKEELDDSYSLFSTGSYQYSWLDESFTNNEREYAYSNMLLCANIKMCIDNLILSRDENDSYSYSYWKNNLIELNNVYDCGTIPPLVREDLDWAELAEKFSDIRRKISTMSDDESLTEELQTEALVFEANVASLFIKMDHTASAVISDLSQNGNDSASKSGEDTDNRTDTPSNTESWWKNNNTYVAENGDSFEIWWYDNDFMILSFSDDQYELHGDEYEIDVYDHCLLYSYAAIEIKYNKDTNSVWIQNGKHEGVFYPRDK